MTAYILLFIMSSISCSGLILSKKFQLNTKFTVSNLLQANFATAIVACIILFIANKCTVNITPTTLIYSAIFGFLSTVSLFFTVYAYAHVSLTLTSIVGSAGGVIVPMIFGFCFNNEPARLRLIISAVLILCAAVLPFLRSGNFSGGKKFIWFLLMYFMFAGSLNILSKLYSQSKNVTDTLSYFFLTNVFMLVICLAGILTVYLKSRKKGDFEVIGMPLIANSCARTVLSLITSYMSIAILAMMPVSLYSVLSASISLAGNAIVSRFIFKENMSSASKVSFVLAMLSIIAAG